MSTRRKVVIGVVVVVVVAGAVVAGIALGSSSSSANSSGTVVLTPVQYRNLQDTVQLTGTLERKEITNVYSGSQGVVGDLYASDGDTMNAGDALFSLNGREAVAEDGTVQFFRPLTIGDSGQDVLQLKQILAAAGDYPGPMTTLFTQQTQFALAQWQAQHGYPNSEPANPESVTVQLEQGPGYQLGAQDSTGLTIGPPPGQTTAALRGRPPAAALDGFHAALDPLVTPTVSIQSVDAQVSEGEPATFVLTASAAPSSDLTVDLTSSGTADSEDVLTPPSSVVLPAGETSTSFEVQTRVDNLVKPTKTLVMTVASGTGYAVGAPGSAETSITNENVPQLSLAGTTSVAPGGSATLTVTASQPPLADTQVAVQFAGSAVPGTDYTPPTPVVTLPAGQTTATITLNTLPTQTLQPNKFIVASLTPEPGSYSVGSQGSAVVTITENTAQPVVTLSSATTYLQKGQPYELTITLSQPTSTPLTIALSYGGTAVEGTDYTPAGGSLTVEPGQSSLEVEVPTVVDNVVEANKVLTVSLAAGSGYQIGSPSSASVTINSQVVPTLTISASTASITQGGAATFTITADQAPVKNTSVGFAVQGTAQPGQAYVPLVGMALLAAGQTSTTVTLQSIQNNIEFEPTDMVVGSWPTRIGTVYVKAGAPIGRGEPVLELTEPNLSVTLQATASDRTKLAVGQQATVTISGGTTAVPGVITELDATPTLVGSSGQSQQQVYEGRIDVPNFNGVDGAQVSISVVDQQVNNAVTVPIAAVLQNGLGADVVRVIDLSAGGRITAVPVTTGLSEGSYIQVTHGLHVGQIVVVQVDQPT